MVAPSLRREMAQWAVAQRSATIGLACQAFGISQTCYRYRAKLDAENAVVADWLVRLTNNQRNWGFGLCFLYLRNVKGFKWNQARLQDLSRAGTEPAHQAAPSLGEGKATAAGRAYTDQRDLVDGFHA